METGTIQFIGTTPDDLSRLIGTCIAGQIEKIKESIPHAEQLLTREQTAELLDIDLSTLYYWTKQNKLKSYGIGNRIYYKRSEIEASLIPINS